MFNKHVPLYLIKFVCILKKYMKLLAMSQLKSKKLSG